MSKMSNSSAVSLGYILKKYRLQSKLDYQLLANKTSIDKRYILALEKGFYQEFNPYNQAFPMIRRLSYVLGLKYSSLIELYQAEYRQYCLSSSKKSLLSRISIHHRNLRTFFMVTVLVSIILYISFFVYRLAYRPVIQLENKSTYLVYVGEEYLLKGAITRSGVLTLNGEDVILDEKGGFSVPINLSPKENRLELVVEKNDKVIDSIQKVIYKSN